MSDKACKESQYMISHPELGLDPPIGLDRESGRDTSHGPCIMCHVSHGHML